MSGATERSALASAQRIKELRHCSPSRGHETPRRREVGDCRHPFRVGQRSARRDASCAADSFGETRTQNGSRRRPSPQPQTSPRALSRGSNVKTGSLSNTKSPRDHALCRSARSGYTAMARASVGPFRWFACEPSCFLSSVGARARPVLSRARDHAGRSPPPSLQRSDASLRHCTVPKIVRSLAAPARTRGVRLWTRSSAVRRRTQSRFPVDMSRPMTSRVSRRTAVGKADGGWREAGTPPDYCP